MIRNLAGEDEMSLHQPHQYQFLSAAVRYSKQEAYKAKLLIF
jgi:hypothetical protein